MTIWQDILNRFNAFGNSVREAFQPQAARDTIGFSIAFIALAAKLAKADGLVTRDEVRAFRSVFIIPRDQEKNAARVFNLCRQDTAGYEAYAEKLEAMFRKDPDAGDIRMDVLDGLFHIAMADDEYHPAEKAFIQSVASIFGLSEAQFLRMEARHVPDIWDPYAVLGVPPAASEAEIDAAWRKAIRENHPDVLRSRGLPDEMMALAHARMIDVNKAREALRGQPPPCGPE
ncbi:MAG: DnaJ family molecular chaperone [Roseibium sp.]|uniref:molecular chaperone DjiA n=1 Tax=Roseibium sp. TaxID=1936156 RepID=UPI003298BA01